MKIPVKTRFLAPLSLLFCLALALASCAAIRRDDSLVANDPIPDGQLMASGSFSGLNGQTASGLAEVYRISADSYVLHLSSISFPEESGLQIKVTVDGLTLSAMTLRASSGDQNYSIAYSGTGSWSQVKIYSPSAFQNYAYATLALH